MPLVLAVVADRQQAAQLTALARGRLSVDLVQAEEAGEALLALNGRVPDLILTSPLMSPFDDGVLAEYLRELGAAGAHVQTLRIPVLRSTQKQSAKGFFSLRRKRAVQSTPDGCDPDVFADEVALYLARAAEERRAASAALPVEPAQFEPDTEATYRSTDGRDGRAFSEPVVSEPYASEIEPLVYESAAAEPFSPEVSAWTGSVEQASEPTIYESAEILHAEVAASEPPLTAASMLEQRAQQDALASEPDVAGDIRNTLILDAPIVTTETTPERTTRGATQEVETPTVVFESAPPEPDLPAKQVASEAPPRTSSFEAALAAIRAAWTPAPGLAPGVTTVSEPVEQEAALAETGRANEVDLTVDLDAIQEPTARRLHEVSGNEMVPGPAPDDPDVYELSASPALHDLDADLAAAAPPAPTPVGTLAPARVDSVDPAAPAPASRRRSDKSKKRPDKGRQAKAREKTGRPVQDEWGIFDPDQCGFSALVDKLHEVTDKEDTRTTERTTVRVISFS